MDRLLNNIKYFKNNIAIKDDYNFSFTYKDLLNFSYNFSNFFERKSLVLCLSKNDKFSLIGYISFLLNKIVPLLLDSKIESFQLQNLLSIYSPEFIWLPEERIKEFPNSQIVFSSNNYFLIRYDLKTNLNLNENLALLLTTSGSTGSPKLVRLSYDNIYENALSIGEYLCINENDRPITTLPMHYSYGLSIINSHLLKGATILLTDKSVMEKEFWNFFHNENATSISGVPFTYEILKKLRFFKMDLPSLKTITQAGGKLNSNLIKEYAEYCELTNKRFFAMYGQTEATARMSYLPSNMAFEKANSIGIAIPKGKFSIVSEDGKLIEESDMIGELVYQGPNVSLGYAECIEDLSKGDENNGKLFTGDLAKRDADGYYYIVGRKKRFIKLFGNRINLDEIEMILKSLVTDCACTGSDDKMEVYINEEGRESEIKSYLSLKTGINHSAFHVKFIEYIPKNSSGKTIYSKFQNL